MGCESFIFQNVHNGEISNCIDPKNRLVFFGFYFKLNYLINNSRKKFRRIVCLKLEIKLVLEV